MKTLEYIEQLIKIPSPTGYTHHVIDYMEKLLSQLGYQPVKTNKGGLLVTLTGKNNQQHRMITAHIDTLGAMVKEIKADGRLALDLIGGFTFNAIESENCLIHTADDKTFTGTILVHQTSVHVYKEAGSVLRQQSNMEVRLDEKVFNAQDVRDLGIEVGDFISFEPRFTVTSTGFIKSRFLDDKISAGILLSLLEQYQLNQKQLPYTTHFYFSNNEEIGYGANSNIPSETVEFLAVDMGAMGDGQQTDEYTVSICTKDSSGPYHYGFRQHLVGLARKHGIGYKLDSYPYYGSDASAALRSGVDVRHALIGAGVESSHSYERSHTESVNAVETLIDVYLKSELC